MSLLNKQATANIQAEQTLIENQGDSCGNTRASVKPSNHSVSQSSNLQASSQNQFSPTASSITRDAAISILNQWQKAKRGILEQN